MMKPKFYEVLAMAIEEGVSRGYARAYKHEDKPTEETVKDNINQAVMSSLHEWFDFDEATEV